MSICNKQHLSNISASIHYKILQQRDWAEKKNVAYTKSVYSKHLPASVHSIRQLVSDNEKLEL